MWYKLGWRNQESKFEMQTVFIYQIVQMKQVCC